MIVSQEDEDALVADVNREDTYEDDHYLTDEISAQSTLDTTGNHISQASYNGFSFYSNMIYHESTISAVPLIQ